jgi:hypothetical protein
MPTLVLRQTIPSSVETRAISARPARPPKPADRSLEGVLLFSGLGFGLLVLAAIFSYLQLPPPYF